MRPCRNVAHFVIIFCVDLTASWYPEQTFWTNVRVAFDFLSQDCAVFSKLLASLVEFIPKYCILFNAILNGVISFQTVHRYCVETTGFGVLTFYPSTLLISFILMMCV